jgi:hypothetical protein
MLDDLDDLFKGEKAGCLYSDPPWGIGNLKYWRTINEQKGHSVDWSLFVKRIKFLYERHVNGPLFLEMGIRFENDLIQAFGKPSAKYDIYYGGAKKQPHIIMCWGAVPCKNPTGMNSNVEAPYTVLSSLPSIPKSVFDCCVGQGTTAKVCKKIGSVCYANELNPKRAEKTMKILNFEKV